MDVFMASLLLADALQAIGIVLNLKWVQDGKVEIGGFCNAQGQQPHFVQSPCYDVQSFRHPTYFRGDWRSSVDLGDFIVAF